MRLGRYWVECDKCHVAFAPMYLAINPMLMYTHRRITQFSGIRVAFLRNIERGFWQNVSAHAHLLRGECKTMMPKKLLVLLGMGILLAVLLVACGTQGD